MAEVNIIELDDISFAYAGAPTFVLENLSLTIKQGSITAIVGASGAGKTTLARLLCGFIPAAYDGTLTGTAQVAGVDTVHSALLDTVAKVGLVSQNPFNQISGAKFTVQEELAFGMENRAVPPAHMQAQIAQVAALLQIEPLLERDPYTLSGGQMQLVGIGSMIVNRPPVLVLDEPTSQLDPAGTRLVYDVLRLLADDGTTVVIVEHKVEQLAKVCTDVAVLYDGAIAVHTTARRAFTHTNARTWGLAATPVTVAARSWHHLGGDRQDLPVTVPEAVSYFGGGK